MYHHGQTKNKLYIDEMMISVLYQINIRWDRVWDTARFMVLLSTIFQLFPGSQFYWRRKPEYPQKTISFTGKDYICTFKLSRI